MYVSFQIARVTLTGLSLFLWQQIPHHLRFLPRPVTLVVGRNAETKYKYYHPFLSGSDLWENQWWAAGNTKLLYHSNWWLHRRNNVVFIIFCCIILAVFVKPLWHISFFAFLLAFGISFYVYLTFVGELSMIFTWRLAKCDIYWAHLNNFVLSESLFINLNNFCFVRKCL